MIIRYIAVTMIALMTGAASAYAHAFLHHAMPPVGGHVSARPTELDLYYTEGVVPHFSSVEVLGPSGQRIDIGPLKAADSGHQLIVPVPPLAPGKYTVIWHVTSEDTHRTEGRYSFTIAP
jgi:methionine-rich copper-binding protein CopC